MFQNYKTIKAKCLDKDGFEILMRVKILKTNEVGDTALNIAKKRRLNDISNILEENFFF